MLVGPNVVKIRIVDASLGPTCSTYHFLSEVYIVLDLRSIVRKVPLITLDQNQKPTPQCGTHYREYST